MFEYKVEPISAIGYKTLEYKINQIALDGWRVRKILNKFNADGSGYLILFEREVK